MELLRKEEKRRELIKEIGQIKKMRRGSVIKQFRKIKLKGKKQPVKFGPYYLHTTKVDGKTISRRLSSDIVKQYQEEINNFRRFQQLAKCLVEVSEEICDLELSARKSIK